MPRRDAAAMCQLVAAGLLFLAAGPVSAQGYQLVQGDTVEVSFFGEVERMVARVDVDGYLRLPNVGGVVVAGLTLDEAEDVIEASLKAGGMFLDSSTTVVLAEYAPILVTGDVANPGRFEYLPRMTVGTALGLSGGSQVSGINRLDITRARTDLAAQARRLNLEIAGTVARIARWEAMLAGTDRPELTNTLRGAIPEPAAVPLEALMVREGDILANDLKRTEELLGFWEEEISTIEAQRELFAQRIGIQDEIVANAEEELARSEQLLEEGLQLTRAVSSAEQVYANARARTLELESAQIEASRSIGNARRARTMYLAEQREMALQGLQNDRLRLDDLRIDFGRVVEQLTNISAGNIASMVASEVFDVRFSIASPREGRPGEAEITSDTLLLPGDMLYVEVEVAAVPSDG